MQDLTLAEFFAVTIMMSPYFFIVVFGLLIFAAIREELTEKHKKEIDDFLLPSFSIHERRLGNVRDHKKSN